jgi:hypothetical protein
MPAAWSGGAAAVIEQDQAAAVANDKTPVAQRAPLRVRGAGKDRPACSAST